LISSTNWNTHIHKHTNLKQKLNVPFTLKKFSEHSVATALAKSVLPTPGGPYLDKNKKNELI
jgi:hypothetical protein